MNKKIIGTLGLSLMVFGASAQITVPSSNKKESGYKFETVKNMEAIDVQNQNRSGTCWSFSALSFFESELIRMGKGRINLSEMFVVRNTYLGKADKFVRMHGNSNFGAGGAFHDAKWVIENYGIVPESAYAGLNYGTDKHIHGEMDDILKGIVNNVIEQNTPTIAWKDAFTGSMDAYLGTPPEKFEVDGKEYTPKSYAKELGFNMDDYVSITSFTHHDFYDQCIIAVPDNWMWGESYNVPLEDMWRIMKEGVENGYTFAWGSDISEKGFSFRDGLAIIPEDMSTIDVKGRDNKHFSDAGAEKKSSAFEEPVKEITVTQEMRQEQYDNYKTQDDHGMHVTGLVKDQNGTYYFVVKNSWGTKFNDNDGYFFASESFVKLKTINILIHKDAVPKDIAKKLGM